MSMISSVAGMAATQGATATNPFAQRMDSVFGSVANLMGTTAADLRSQLQGGQSLATLAQSKGISQSQLTAAIQQGIQQADAASGTSTSPDRLAAIANNIANRVPEGSGHHGHHGHHGGGGGGVGAVGSTSTAQTLDALLAPTDPTASTDPLATALAALTTPNQTTSTLDQVL